MGIIRWKLGSRLLSETCSCEGRSLVPPSELGSCLRRSTCVFSRVPVAKSLFGNARKSAFQNRTSPLPHPATHRILPLGGRVGERAGAAMRRRAHFQTDFNSLKDHPVIRLAIISLVIAAVLAILGFGGAAGTFVGIAKFLFFLAIVLFVIFLVLDLLAGKGIKKAID